jgi:hypothetical protein
VILLHPYILLFQFFLSNPFVKTVRLPCDFAILTRALLQVFIVAKGHHSKTTRVSVFNQACFNISDITDATIEELPV